jgi:hypothetical protein
VIHVVPHLVTPIQALDSFTSLRRDDVAAAVQLSDRLQVGGKARKSAAAKPSSSAAASVAKAAAKGVAALAAIRLSLWGLRFLAAASRAVPVLIRPPAMVLLQTSLLSYSQGLQLLVAEQEKALAMAAFVAFAAAVTLRALLGAFGVPV